MKKRYTIGIDFGTLSARAVLLDAKTGKALKKDSTYVYPHAILKEIGGKALPLDYALEHPADYIEALECVIKGVIKENGIDAREVEGIGIDVTASTLIPVYNDLTPLCFDARFENEPHAYVKMWKHHGAQKYMELVKGEAERYGESFVKRCGSGISVESTIPKLVEMAKDAPCVYDEAERIMNMGDFLVSLLIGKAVYSSAYASMKDGWDIDDGFPSKEYMRSLDKRLENVFEEKMGGTPIQVGELAGFVCEEWSERTGLSRDTAVAVAIVDAHASFLLAGLEDGLALVSVGTSSGFNLNAFGGHAIGGVMSCGRGALLKDMMTYDAGLSCVGDLFDWFVKTSVPASYENEAREKGVNIHALLCEKAQGQAIGEHGLVILGWWNGNRCTLANGDLTGVVVGMKLSTRPEDIYRALIEATAFGMKNIMNNYENNGLPIKRIMVTGGIALKNPMLMRIYADVLGRELHIIDSEQTTALGSAICGTVASGRYKDMREASLALRAGVAKTYSPVPANVSAYAKIFEKYMTLHDYFGK